MKLLRLYWTLIAQLAAFASSPVHAQLTGTLFTTPEQRAYLDYLRQDFLARSRERGFDITEADIPDIPVQGEATETPGAPVVHTLGGIVTLRDGTRRIWLDGKALTENELPDGARLVTGNGGPALRFTTTNGSYLLRPGQTLQLTEGNVTEKYQRQQQMPEPAPAAAEPADDAQAAAETDTAPAASPEVQEAAVATTEEQNGEAVAEPTASAEAPEGVPAGSVAELRDLLRSIDEATQAGNAGD
jgi:hypothetical protein